MTVHSSFLTRYHFQNGLRKLKGTSSNLCYTEASLEGTLMESVTGIEEINDLFQIYFQDCVVSLKIASLKTSLPKWYDNHEEYFKEGGKSFVQKETFFALSFVKHWNWSWQPYYETEQYFGCVLTCSNIANPYHTKDMTGSGRAKGVIGGKGKRVVPNATRLPSAACPSLALSSLYRRWMALSGCQH